MRELVEEPGATSLLVFRPANVGSVNVRPATLLLGIGVLVITACSTTALSSAPPPPSSAPAVTVPSLPDEAPEPALRDEPVEIDDEDEFADEVTTDEVLADEVLADEDTMIGTEIDDPLDQDASVADEAEADPVDQAAEEAELVAFAREFRPVEVLDPPLRAMGTSSGSETVRLQERLLDLGFWVQATDGSYGLTTRQAVMAFQKYLGLPADGVMDETTAAYMSQLTERPQGRADAGTLIEVDKTRQLLFIVIEGRTEWILNTSTGTEIPYERPNANNPDIIERGSSITPNGLHNVNRSHADGWREGDLGEIYRPRYFIGGVAVHGSNSIPNYAASHGCVRVSVPAMDWIWENDFMPMGSPVWVHGEIPDGRL